MPNYKKKSEENLSAADLLINNNMYTSSVHCSYYAGLQFSKYVLANKCGIGYEDQEQNSKGKDSHYFVSDKTGKALDKKGGHLSYIDYNKFFSKLKNLRKKADYSEILIERDEAKKAYDYADKLIYLLKTKFAI